jgi:hypothetical protein
MTPCSAGFDSPVVRDGGEFDLADAVAAHDLLDRDLKAFDEGFHKALSECDPEFRDFAEKKIKRDWDQYSEEVCPYDAPWLYDSDGASIRPHGSRRRDTPGRRPEQPGLMRSQSRLRLT